MNPTKYLDLIGKHFGTEQLTELYHTNEFTLAVAVILSAQTTDKMVNRVTPALFEVADTPEKMLALGEAGLKEHIKVLSFFNNKAANIIKTAGILSSPLPCGGGRGEATGGGFEKATSDKPAPGRKAATPSAREGVWRFPPEYHNRDMLMTLPGIGQKTANVVSSILWGAPNIGVDTHVFRLAHRLGWATDADNTPEKVERRLLSVIPKKLHSVANHLMVMHGRYICTARKPNCENCPVGKLCDWKKGT